MRRLAVQYYAELYGAMDCDSDSAADLLQDPSTVESRLRRDLKGIPVTKDLYGAHVSLSAYADDITVLITAQGDVEVLKRSLEIYERASSARVNWVWKTAFEVSRDVQGSTEWILEEPLLYNPLIQTQLLSSAGVRACLLRKGCTKLGHCMDVNGWKSPVELGEVMGLQSCRVVARLLEEVKSALPGCYRELMGKRRDTETASRSTFCSWFEGNRWRFRWIQGRREFHQEHCFVFRTRDTFKRSQGRICTMSVSKLHTRLI
ncbi:hypothetical protein AOLI_G00264140 [Acnodon oligacanthus]